MNNTKTYTAIDFEAYYKGNMALKDMHALENAALNDPFLADALEGYQYTSTAVLDNENLIKRLKQQTKKKTNVFGISKVMGMRVAASAALLVGLGYLFYTLNSKNNVQPLAKNTAIENLELQKEANIEPTATTTTNKNKTELLEQKNKDIVIQMQPLPATTMYDDAVKEMPQPIINSAPKAPATANEPSANIEKESAKSDITDNQPQINTKKEEVDNISNAKRSAAQKENDAFKNNNTNQNNGFGNTYNYSGVVQSPTGGPMQNASLRMRSNNRVTQTDQNGRFTFAAADSVTEVTVAAKGYANVDITLNANTSNAPIFLQNNNNQLNEVLVNGYATKKSKQSSADVAKINTNDLSKINKPIDIEKGLTGKVGGAQVERKQANNYILTNKDINKTDSAKVSIATARFYNNVNKQIKPIFNEKGNEIKGKVTLSFKASKKGNPQNIIVVKSLCSSCDKQAIQLLKNADQWPYINGLTQMVTIAF